jgi:predicted RNA-binding Zn-ribbon protein involved in translation (DUF1610 family)
MSKVRLIDARICLDCDVIYHEDQYKYCPACGSTQAMRVDNCIRSMNPIIGANI